MIPLITPGNWHGLRELVEESEHEDDLLKQGAMRLYNAIDGKIGKGPNGLYRTAINDDRECTGSNATMGILACLLGDECQGKDLYKLIKNTMGKTQSAADDQTSRLYLSDAAIDWGNAYADDNAEMGVLACLVGKKTEAGELYAGVKNRIGKEVSGLYLRNVHSLEDTESNAFMGVLAVLLDRREEAEEQYRLINEKIGRKKSGFYNPAPGIADDVCVSVRSNAAMGILAFLLDMKDEARRIYASIDGKMGRMQSGLFGNCFDEKSKAYVEGAYAETNATGEYAETNATIGILACLLAGAQMKP